MADCIFCKIINREIPADFVLENDKLVAFKDIKPSAPIHYLIVPKEHIQSIAHLEGNHRDVLASLIYSAKDLASKLNLKGYKLAFNVGREGGQIVDHLHLHLMGGWKGDSEIRENHRDFFKSTRKEDLI
ncbi:MAG: histidine triad nucleotide-binding protein [Candidatus Pacebacteria bacterium]|nr:histidine triad nucleotide-binding protein [Candidatus Paceibacterota bacterium]